MSSVAGLAILIFIHIIYCHRRVLENVTSILASIYGALTPNLRDHARGRVPSRSASVPLHEHLFLSFFPQPSTIRYLKYSLYVSFSIFFYDVDDNLLLIRPYFHSSFDLS